MRDEDFADGIYWVLDAINYTKGGGYDFSCGIDYRNDVFETFNFWSHCECSCSYQKWEWDTDAAVEREMEKYDLPAKDSEYWRLWYMEWGNVTQGQEPDHDEDCTLEDVGFRHFASGLEVSWYKRVGRSTKSNKSLKTLDWYKIVVECLESVRDGRE